LERALGFAIFRTISEKIWPLYHHYILFLVIILLLIVIFSHMNPKQEEKRRELLDEQSIKEDQDIRSEAESPNSKSSQKMGEEGGSIQKH